MGFEDVGGWLYHATVAVPVEFVEIGLLVADKFHHTGQILVFVVAAIEFQFAVTTDENKGRTVGTYPVEFVLSFCKDTNFP